MKIAQVHQRMRQIHLLEQIEQIFSRIIATDDCSERTQSGNFMIIRIKNELRLEKCVDCEL